MTLSCNVSGNPEPSISWSKDEFQVNTTINSRISFSADKTQLTITKAKRTDNGNYRCVVNNSLGIATSDAAIVNVQCKSNMLVNSLFMTQWTAYISGTLLSFSFKSPDGGLETLLCVFFILYPACCSYPSVAQIEYCNKTMRNNNMCLWT